MKDDIKLPPMPYPYDTPAYRTVGAVIQDYARSAIKADRQRRGEPVAWHTEDHLTDKSATTYDPIVAERWLDKGWSVTPLFNASQPAEPVNAPSDDNTLTIAYMCGYNDSKRSATPDGWQLVPKIPTKEMLLAGKHTIKGADTTFEVILADYAYLSMLAAAPNFGEA